MYSSPGELLLGLWQPMAFSLSQSLSSSIPHGLPSSLRKRISAHGLWLLWLPEHQHWPGCSECWITSGQQLPLHKFPKYLLCYALSQDTQGPNTNLPNFPLISNPAKFPPHPHIKSQIWPNRQNPSQPGFYNSLLSPCISPQWILREWSQGQGQHWK